MRVHEKNSIRYYTFDSFDEVGVPHALFTRRGGVSPIPWDELNVGGTVGDERSRVVKNIELAFEAVDRDPRTRFDAWQVHGADIIYTDSPRDPQQLPHQADGILTEASDVTLFMRFADCVPIMLYDKQQHVAGIVHAGWLGTIKRVGVSAVQEMGTVYDSLPSNIIAGIGPSICKAHYEVGAEVVEQVKHEFGSVAEDFLFQSENQKLSGKAQLDLWKLNEFCLRESGVDQIEISGICTACNADEWYSHRARRGKTGRFGALIGVPGS